MSASHVTPSGLTLLRSHPCCPAALLIWLCSVAPALSAQRVIVGVLDHPPCHEQPSRAVRMLFVKDSAAWRAIAPRDAANAATVPTTWTIGFDGTDRGMIHTQHPLRAPSSTSLFRRDYLLTLAGTQVPFAVTMPARSANVAGDTIPNAFGGWCEHGPSRPLVVVSTSHTADPDRWRPHALAPEDLLRVVAAFRPHADSAEYCPSRRDIAVPLPVRAEYVDVVSSYGDSRDRRLVAVRLKPPLRMCDGPADDAWLVHWFAVTTSARFIARGLTLIDAGDYDGDGASELVFWYSGYNSDGYVLLRADLRRRVEYLWSYH